MSDAASRTEVQDRTDFGWAGQAVALDSVERELGRAWREGSARESADGGAPLAVRTHVLNLIVVTTRANEVRHVARLLEDLGIHHPSRTLIVLLEPDTNMDGTEAWVKSHLHDLAGTGRRLAFEQVTIVAKGKAARGLSTLVDPLLIAELPNFLWWLGEPPFHESAFTHLLEIVDRLIVNSACFVDLERAFHELAEVAVIPNGVVVSDFAWAQLRPWRELIAQFFDPPNLAASLTTIERVELTYEPHVTTEISGLSKGVLLLGWLCSRLNWQVMAPAQHLDGGAYHWRLQAGEQAIEAMLRPEHADDEIAGLRGLVLTAGGNHPGTFQVFREGMARLATAVNVPGVPQPTRLTRAALRDELELLLHDLNQFTRDSVFDGALVFAARLCQGIEKAAR